MIRNCGEGRHGKVKRAAISRQAHADSQNRNAQPWRPPASLTGRKRLLEQQPAGGRARAKPGPSPRLHPPVRASHQWDSNHKVNFQPQNGNFASVVLFLKRIKRFNLKGKHLGEWVCRRAGLASVPSLGFGGFLPLATSHSPIISRKPASSLSSRCRHACAFWKRNTNRKKLSENEPSREFFITHALMSHQSP